MENCGSFKSFGFIYIYIDYIWITFFQFDVRKDFFFFPLTWWWSCFSSSLLATQNESNFFSKTDFNCLIDPIHQILICVLQMSHFTTWVLLAILNFSWVSLLLNSCSFSVNARATIYDLWDLMLVVVLRFLTNVCPSFLTFAWIF